MAEEYSRDIVKVSVAKILQTIGWNSINSSPLEILTDILVQYVRTLSRTAHDYANNFGCVAPNLDHLALAFKDHHVNLNELEEFVTYVNFGPPPVPVPKYPIPKENNLNFLKPGSKEVITRPVYVHEYLPPMYDINEASEAEAEAKIKTEDEEEAKDQTTPPVFKRPAEVSPGESFKRPRLLMEEEGRPTREISSVMMTTSGYISPAREGKLPESRTPLASLDTVTTTNNASANSNSNNAIKPNKVFKKVEKRKEKVGKELFKATPPNEEKGKKATTMKDIVKLKQMKAVNANSTLNGHPPNSSFVLNNEVKACPPAVNNTSAPDVPAPSPAAAKTTTGPNSNKVNKALAAARLKTEKLNTTITPIPIKPPPNAPLETIDKLQTEPDKKKVNILKKISNVRNEKLENKILKLKDNVKQESREGSPDLIIDDAANELNNKVHISNDITIELIDMVARNTSDKIKSFVEEDSMPGTPQTPKTPEVMTTHSPPVVLTKEPPTTKRKRKDKSRIKKVQKPASPPRAPDPEAGSSLMDVCPKTPDAHVPPPLPMPPPRPDPPPFAMNIMPPGVQPFPLLTQFNGPGLIPPLFPNVNMTSLFMPPNPMMGSLGSPFGMSPMRPDGSSGPPPSQPPHAAQPAVPPQPPPAVLARSPIVYKSPPPMLSTTDNSAEPDAPDPIPLKPDKKAKEHRKEKKDKIKKKNKKDKVKNKAEKKKLKEEKKDKVKKEKKEKKKDKELRENLEITIPKLTLKLGTPSPRPDTPETKKLNIKPILKKEVDEVDVTVTTAGPSVAEEKRELSPELAKISALVTGQPKPKANALPPPVPANIIPPDTFHLQTKKSMFKPIPKIRPKEFKKEPVEEVMPAVQSKYIDSEGNEVWICPVCERQDDGSPMIGCDDCDAWYHWVCVGIFVPPDEAENWYCKYCLQKKEEVHQLDKKKKRKKREKKEH